MAAADILDTYRRTCLQPVAIRRYSGTPRTPQDYAANGNARLYSAAELVGSVQQGDQRVIVIAADLIESGLALPVTNNDRVVVDGLERRITVVGERKALESDDGGKSILIAYELTARG